MELKNETNDITKYREDIKTIKGMLFKVDEKPIFEPWFIIANGIMALVTALLHYLTVTYFQFSILEFTWNEMANPFENIKWSNMGIVNIGNQIYVIGGKRNNSFTNYNYAYQAFYTIVLPFIEK